MKRVGALDDAGEGGVERGSLRKAPGGPFAKFGWIVVCPALQGDGEDSFAACARKLEGVFRQEFGRPEAGAGLDPLVALRPLVKIGEADEKFFKEACAEQVGHGGIVGKARSPLRRVGRENGGRERDLRHGSAPRRERRLPDKRKRGEDQNHARGPERARTKGHGVGLAGRGRPAAHVRSARPHYGGWGWGGRS